MSRAAAIIEDGKVVNIASITDDEQGFDFAHSQGWVVLPENYDVDIGWLYDGSTFSPPPVVVVPVESYQVDQERDRRISVGFIFDGKTYQTESQSDRENILGALGTALAAIAVDGAQAGNLHWADPGFDFFWIAADNSRVPMDAQTCLAFARAAVARKSLLVIAGNTLKQLQPIPQDYTDDKYWPPVESTTKARTSKG
ncbi:DUF4376 domain-containing protein [Pseudomonas oryzihabitans]|uniref:DUF4376 domain-containing protein n=1 Tax=Pseudomonas oryzihabitans TaxID=47885 RepID=UPI00142F1AE6|nr:DUF4376 domain-containing protein [Pseudomonas psychrotolerans]